MVFIRAWMLNNHSCGNDAEHPCYVGEPTQSLITRRVWCLLVQGDNIRPEQVVGRLPAPNHGKDSRELHTLLETLD